MKRWNPAASGHLHDLMNAPWPIHTASTETSTTAYEVELPATAGIAELDRLHDDLIDLLAGLAVCVDREFAARYRQFVGNVEFAFRNEEEWMEGAGYANIPIHCAEHARVLSALHKVHAQVMTGQLDQARRVADELLPQWFSLHFETFDADLAQALQRGNARMLMPRC